MKRIIACLLLGELALSAFGETVKVKFDGNGGRASAAVQSFDDGEEYCGLPSASRNGYLFAGWWTEKEGGTWVPDCDEFDASIFAGQKTPTLYAHWKAIVKLTLKDDSAYVEWEPWESYGEGVVDFLSRPDLEGGGHHEGKGTVELLEGTRVYVYADSYTYDSRGKELEFQKWTVSPSSANLGPYFHVSFCATEFTMPGVALTLQATYIDESVCGWVTGYANASPVTLGDTSIEPPYDAFEWSPDGGKTWYKAGPDSSSSGWDDDDNWDEEDSWNYIDDDDGDDDGYWGHSGNGESAMLKIGTYTVIWRSNDPNWTTTTGKQKVTVTRYYVDTFATFVYVPQVVVDVMTHENGKCTKSSVGGTITMNPKDGFVPAGKTISLTAKAAKNYAFQGWAFQRTWNFEDGSAGYWAYGDMFNEISATWKLENYLLYDSEVLLNEYIDPSDKKVHIVAVFKALSDYSADEIVFKEFKGDRSSVETTGGNTVEIKAVVGCALNYALVCGPVAAPLIYKLNGKLPDGLKFNAKTGTISGVPKKPGDTKVAIMATDPAKNVKSLTVNFHVSSLPEWLVGEYRGTCVGDVMVWEPSEYMGETVVFSHEQGGRQPFGLLELSVKSDGKVSGKVITGPSTYSVSGSLTWYDSKSYNHDYDDLDGSFFGDEDFASQFAEFQFTDDKGYAHWHVKFFSDGTISGEFWPGWVWYGIPYAAGGSMSGMRQDKELLAKSNFLDKYYTFAFDTSWFRTGSGYLTLKTDAKGAVKVVGQLPDGEKVSVSALLLPMNKSGNEKPEADDISARIFVFSSPSSKKFDWFTMPLVIWSDGSVYSEDSAVWTSADYGYESNLVEGHGALYSEAKTLEGYYWNVSCVWNDEVQLEYSWKEGSYTEHGYESAHDFDEYLFNVKVKGDSKGAINLAQKSPAPWDDKSMGEWNYLEDKKGNEITDPSQLSISFAKATGIFTGKASVYFDYAVPHYNSRTGDYDYTMKHTTATLPYSGVMVREENDGEVSYTGFGSAVYSYKYTTVDETTGKSKTSTKKVTLPVRLEPEQ